MEPRLDYAPALPEDIEALFAFNRALIDEYEDPAAVDRNEVLAWVRRKLEKKLGEYVRVLLDGKLAGYYRLAPGEGGTELDDFYVFPEYRGRGIGTAALRKCCAEAALPLYLYVFTKNAGAVRLYERNGFRLRETVDAARCILEYDGK